MNSWFECKVTYERQSPEDGGMQKVTETYLLGALSFTEAEARIIEEVQPFVSIGSVIVSNIRRLKIAEFFDSEDQDDSFFYRLKVNMIIYDEKSGKEKKNVIAILIKSDTIINAINRLVKEYEGLNYEIVSVTETAIMDVYKYEGV